MWHPVPPPGYVALGSVVLAGPLVPVVEDYICLREDLVEPSRVFDSAVWSYDASASLMSSNYASSSQPLPTYHAETWKVSVWQIDNQLGTFIAVRSLSPPPKDSAKTVKEVELKAKERELSRSLSISN